MAFKREPKRAEPPLADAEVVDSPAIELVSSGYHVGTRNLSGWPLQHTFPAVDWFSSGYHVGMRKLNGCFSPLASDCCLLYNSWSTLRLRATEDVHASSSMRRNLSDS